MIDISYNNNNFYYILSRTSLQSPINLTQPGCSHCFPPIAIYHLIAIMHLVNDRSRLVIILILIEYYKVIKNKTLIIYKSLPAEIIALSRIPQAVYY